MPTRCTDDDRRDIRDGDLVVVSGWDGAPNDRPKVRRARKTDIRGPNAKRLYGVAATSSAGGAVDVLTAGAPVEPTAEALEEALARPYEVREYGAVGDGVTNDSAAFAAAIDAMNELHITREMILTGGPPLLPAPEGSGEESADPTSFEGIP
jgi:hypothetical protein